MIYQLGLSSEEIASKPDKDFYGVGLIRGEYICRRLNKYITCSETQEYLYAYLNDICEIFRGEPVWYRFIEMEVTEVNILEGADFILNEKNTMLGLRGIRRSLTYIETFKQELSIIAKLAQKHKNLNVLIPFINDISELDNTIKLLEEFNFKNQIGIMAEIPSTIICLEEFLTRRISNVTIGINDLSSLVLGMYRGHDNIDITHKSIIELISLARIHTKKAGIPLSLAGYFNKKLLNLVDVDYAIVHYSKLPDLFGDKYKFLQGLLDLDSIKALTRMMIKKDQEERILKEALRNKYNFTTTF